MMNIDKFREIIKERNRIARECYDEWTFGIEQCWKQELEILSEDISSTINFLENECTADEYSWISEIIDDLAESTRSRELVQAYKSLMTKYPDECKMYHISDSIQFAENALSDEVDDGEES